MLGIVVPVLDHPDQPFPLVAISLVCGDGFTGMNFGVCLNPLARSGIGNFVFTTGIKGRYGVDADNPVVGVVLGVDNYPKVHVDRASLLAYRILAILLGEGSMEIVQHYRCGLAMVMLLGLLQHKEDINVLKRFSLRVARVGPRQKAARNTEFRFQIVTHLVLTL